MVVWPVDIMETILKDEGRPREFDEQLEALFPKLLLHALALTRSMQTAEDLVQDTCARAIDRYDQWRSSRRFDGWVASIMESIWRNELRQKAQRQEQELPEPDQVPERGFESQIHAKLMIDKLRAYSMVSDEDFGLVVRVYLYKYTHRELAEEYRTPLGTMLSRVHRIRAAVEKAERDLEGAA